MDLPEDKTKTIELFRQGPGKLENAISDLSENDLDYAPANGGRTIRQIIHHIADGDDLWKTAVKMALGNEKAEFTLQWYLTFPQVEWAKRWNYEKRSINESLTLLRASRVHILQLLKYTPDGWSKSVQYKGYNGEIEIVPIGFIVQMQADHIVHHIKRISEIRKEISDK